MRNKYKYIDIQNPTWKPQPISPTQQKAHTCTPATTPKPTTPNYPNNSNHSTKPSTPKTADITKLSLIGTKMNKTT